MFVVFKNWVLKTKVITSVKYYCIHYNVDNCDHVLEFNYNNNNIKCTSLFHPSNKSASLNKCHLLLLHTGLLVRHIWWIYRVLKKNRHLLMFTWRPCMTVYKVPNSIFKTPRNLFVNFKLRIVIRSCTVNLDYIIVSP